MSFEFSPGDALYAFVVWIALVFLIGLVILLLLDLKQALLSNKWTGQEATLKAIEIDHRDVGEGGPEYRPKIEYVYRVGSVTYSSKRFSYRSPWTHDYFKASGHFSGLVVGSTFTVYVCPGRPSKSVVLRGADIYNWFAPFLGIVFIWLLVSGLFQHYSI